MKRPIIIFYGGLLFLTAACALADLRPLRPRLVHVEHNTYLDQWGSETVQLLYRDSGGYIIGYETLWGGELLPGAGSWKSTKFGWVTVGATWKSTTDHDPDARDVYEHRKLIQAGVLDGARDALPNLPGHNYQEKRYEYNSEATHDHNYNCEG